MAKQLIIDVGMTALRILQVNTRKKRLIVTDAVVVPYAERLTPGNLANIVAGAIAEARADGRFRGRSATLGLAADLTWLRPVSLPPVAAEANRLRAIVDYEAEQQIPFPLHEVCWDYHLMVHDEHDAEAIYAVVKREIVNELLRAMQQARLRVERLSCAPVALYNLACAHGFGTGRCDMVIDFGARTTTVLILLDDRVFVRTIGIGGDTLTKAIAKRFDLDFASAEYFKLRHAHAADADLCIDDTPEVTAVIAHETRSVLDRLSGELRRSIAGWRTSTGIEPVAVHLTGGGSTIPFLDDYLASRLRLPPEAFQPLAPFQTMPTTAIENPLAHHFATAAGLAIEAGGHGSCTIDLLPRTEQQERGAAAALPYVAAAALLWLSLLTGGMLLAERQAEVTKTALTSAQATASKLDEAVAVATDFQIDAQLRQQQRHRLAELAARRQAMITLWDAIERARPAVIVLTGTTPITQTERGAPAHTSFFAPLSRPAPTRQSIGSLRLQGTITAQPGRPIYSEAELARLPLSASEGPLPSAAGDERNVAIADPSRAANLFLAALEALPEFRAGGGRYLAFLSQGDGRAQFSLELTLQVSLADWQTQ